MKAYLSHDAFTEPETGPLVGVRGRNSGKRSPSEEQIAARCAAIRATWDEVRMIQSLGSCARYTREKMGCVSQATHVPHGVSAESIGALRCQDMML